MSLSIDHVRVSFAVLHQQWVFWVRNNDSHYQHLTGEGKVDVLHTLLAYQTPIDRDYFLIKIRLFCVLFYDLGDVERSNIIGYELFKPRNFFRIQAT